MKSRIKLVGRGKGRMSKSTGGGSLWPSPSPLFIALVILIVGGTMEVEAGKGDRDRDRDRASVEVESQSPTQHEPEASGSSAHSQSSAAGAGAGQGGGSGGVHTHKYDKYSPSASAPLYPHSASASASAAAQQQALNYYSAYGYPSQSSSSSNANPYHYNTQASYYSPYSSAEPYWTERTGRDFSTRTSNNIPMATSSNNYAYESTGPGQSHEFGGQAMASSHGGGGGHGGGGHGGGGHGGGGGGWGWKGASHGGGNTNTNALGVLALIGLLSLLQNALSMLTTTTAATTAAGRRKRDVVGDGVDDFEDATADEGGVHSAERISLMVLPSLNVIAHAREGRVPLECSHREMCLTNQLLVQELGAQGRSVGSIISSAVTKLLKEADKTGVVGKHISKASLAGQRGEDCHVMYPVCSALEKEGRHSLPLLVQPHHLTHLVPIKRQNQNHNQNPPPTPYHKSHFQKRKKTVKKPAGVLKTGV